jgi:nitrite reductase (NADH) large subunit
MARLQETLSYTSDPWQNIIQNDELRKNFTDLNDSAALAGTSPSAQ